MRYRTACLLVGVSCLCLSLGCRVQPMSVGKAASADSTPTLRAAVQISRGIEDEGFPHVSKDGESIAFIRVRDKRAEVFTQSVAGTQQTKQFSVHGGSDFTPAWHRHGKSGKDMIAFASDSTRTATIWEGDPSGAGAQRQIVSDDPAWHYYEPDVNAVTGKLAFVRSRSAVSQADPLATLKYDADCYIMVCNHDGTDLTEFVKGVNPRWSPDGKRLAFARRGLHGNYDIWVVDANGANLTQVTFHPGNEIEPAWSPDGTRIAYAGDTGYGMRLCPCVRHSTSFDIWVIRTDGANPVQLTTAEAFEGRPTYAPNGDIYFHAFDRKCFGRKRLGIWRLTPTLPPEG